MNYFTLTNLPPHADALKSSQNELPQQNQNNLAVLVSNFYPIASDRNSTRSWLRSIWEQNKRSRATLRTPNSSYPSISASHPFRIAARTQKTQNLNLAVGEEAHSKESALQTELDS